MIMPTLTHNDYKVGWICALPLELTAATAMLDERHTPLPRLEGDDNVYTLGRIANHNVVITCLGLGHTGTSSASFAAAQMRISFKSIKEGINLMVGIGGGVPSEENDIRLGDVVVSKPGTKSGGVVQYDFGKTVQEGRFMQTGTLNAPPPLLLSALSHMWARSDCEGNTFLRYLAELPPKMLPKYTYPGAEQDQLFDANYDHVDGAATCEHCDQNMLVKRPERHSPDPVVHYGTIASANQVMRDGATRDRLRKKFDILCFEMEAAGLMNNFRCAVIRGICDYADSHKNKQWQPYAAVVAAAYAKGLLSNIPPEEVVIGATRATPSPAPTLHTPPQPSTSSDHLSPGERSSTSDTDQLQLSRSTQALPAPPAFVYKYRLLPRNAVALGRLVTETQAPWENYHHYPFDLPRDDVMIIPQPRLHEIIKSAKGPIRHTLENISSCLTGNGDWLDGSDGVQEKTYTLKNSPNYFDKFSGQHSTREWFETVIKHGWNPYMIVGFHTVPESLIRQAGLDPETPSISDADKEKVEAELAFAAAGEVVVAVQYIKIQFKWHSSRKVGAAFLKMGSNRWKVFSLSGNRSEFEDEDDDIVEAVFQGFDVEESEGDANYVGGNLFTNYSYDL